MSDTPTKQDWLNVRPRLRPNEPDPFGQAALLLIESLMYALVEARVLTLDQALDAAQTAADVKVELAHETGEAGDTLRQSLNLLHRIERSMASMHQSPA